MENYRVHAHDGYTGESITWFIEASNDNEAVMKAQKTCTGSEVYEKVTKENGEQAIYTD